MKTTHFSLGLILLFSLFSSCSLDFDLDIPVPCLFCYDVNPIEKGLQTTVSGGAFDYNLRKPIVGVKVYLEHNEDVGYRKATYVDSTFTDPYGNYSFNFTTDGIAYSYYVEFRPAPQGHYETYSFEYEIHNFGKSEVIDFNAARMKIAILDIHVIDNPNPPMLVRTHQGFFAQKIPGIDYDTTVWLFVKPNTVNSITFSINNPDTLFRINYQIDTINLIGNFKDSVRREFTVRPKEFRLRRNG
jgi:hypothetical protein